MKKFRSVLNEVGLLEFITNGPNATYTDLMGPSSLNEGVRRGSSREVTMLPDGGKKVEDGLSISYWKDGQLHRTDGPAFYRKDPKTGKLLYCYYYVNGHIMSYDDWHLHFTDATVNNLPVHTVD